MKNLRLLPSRIRHHFRALVLRRKGRALMRRYMALADLFDGHENLERALPQFTRYRRLASRLARQAKHHLQLASA